MFCYIESKVLAQFPKDTCTLSWRKQGERRHIWKIISDSFLQVFPAGDPCFRWLLRLYCFVHATLKYVLHFDIGCDIWALFSNSQPVIVLCFPSGWPLLIIQSLDFWCVQDCKNEEQRVGWCVVMTVNGYSSLYTIFLEAANSAKLLGTLIAKVWLLNGYIIFHYMFDFIYHFGGKGGYATMSYYSKQPCIRGILTVQICSIVWLKNKCIL